MSDLTDFVLARIANDEDLARAADQQSGRTVGVSGESEVVSYVLHMHPKRALAQCVANRRIVELAIEAEQAAADNAAYAAAADYLDTAVRELAATWSSHPDYRADEWRPDRGSRV